MNATVNTKPVAEMDQVERHLFAHAEGNPDDADFDPERWVYVPDFRTDLIRSRVFKVFGQQTDAPLHDQYRRLRSHYHSHATDDPMCEEPVRSLDGMIAWWKEREACYPLVLSRQADDSFFLWDGCHRALHFLLAEPRATLPVLVGVGAAPPIDGGKRYAPACTLNGTRVTLHRHRYGNDRVAVEALCPEGPFCKVTVNVPHEHLADDEVFVKNWSECEGFLDQLEDQGVVRRTGRVVKSGYVEVPTALLLV